MRTTAQKRRQAAMLKAASIAVAVAVVTMPKLDSLELPEFDFPLVTMAVADEAGEKHGLNPSLASSPAPASLLNRLTPGSKR